MNKITKLISILLSIAMLMTISLVFASAASSSYNPAIGDVYTTGPYTVTLNDVSSDKIPDVINILDHIILRNYDKKTGIFAIAYQLKGTPGFQNVWPSDYFLITPSASCSEEYKEDFVLEKQYDSTVDPKFTHYLPYKIRFSITVSRPAIEHNGDATCENAGTCTVCGETYTATCKGGTATCVKKAVCDVCGKEYGEFDADNHNWSNLNGICANGCGTECTHTNQTGKACGICGQKLYKTLSGTVTSFGSETDEVTLLLYQAGDRENAYETTVTGNSAEYAFERIEEGEYILEVLKDNHATRFYEVTVGEVNVTVDAKIHLIGDIDGDGTITVTDYSKILKHVKKTTQLEGYEMQCADIDGNGKITIADYSKSLRHVKKTAFLW